MKFTSKEKSNWYMIIESQGISPRGASHIVSFLTHMEKYQGSQSVVNYLKLLASDLFSGTEPGVKRHVDGSWAGPFHQVWKLAKRVKRPRDSLTKALRILKLTGRWEGVVTPEHAKKFLDTIQGSPPPSSESLASLTSDIIKSLTPEDKYLGRRSQDLAFFRTTYPAGVKKSPIGFGFVEERQKILPHEHYDAAVQMAPRMVAAHYDLLRKVVTCSEPPIWDVSEKDTDCVGTVSGLTKDGNLKVRFVANPLMLFQLTMSRLKSACRLYLEQMPESNVFNQEKGEDWVSSQLKAGYSLTSLDLTSCSDLLPADPQFRLLHKLFPSLDADIKLFHDISRARWFLKVDGLSLDHRRIIRWHIGQALGTDPSFFAFTIFLIHIVRACGGDATSFRVIGDDLIMRSELTETVVSRYESISLPINKSKSIFNNKHIGNFAGRYITKEGRLHVYKASAENLFADPLGLVRQYGYKALRWINVSYRKRIAVIALLPKPIGLGREGTGLLGRIPGRVVQQLYGEKLKEVPPKVCKSVDILDGFWQVKHVHSKHIHPGPCYYYQQAVEKMAVGTEIPLLFITAFLEERVGSINPFHPDFSTVMGDLTPEARAALRGCGTWLIECLKPFDLDAYRSTLLYNDFVRERPLVSDNEHLLKEIGDTLKKKMSTGESRYSEDSLLYKKQKSPMFFLRRVWKRIKPYFPGRLTE